MMETVYFGTYTKKMSQGIYAADFDSESGLLSNLRLVAKETNPTYLAFSNTGNLYSVASQDGKGGIASFNSNFELLNHVVEEGAPHCFISVDDERHLVYGANYHKGEALIYQQNEDGSLALLNKEVYSGSGPHPNQLSSHVHFVGLTPDKYLVVCDLGTDLVTTYDILENYQLEKIGQYHSTPGAGSRHIVFHPDLKVAYLICELNATVEVLIYDGCGQFERFDTISTLPEAYNGFNACAAIRISQDGKFVYASNRGDDSLAVFSVATDGSLKRIQIISTSGKNPRDFNITPDGAYIITVHQDSDNATVFKRDQETGLLNTLSNDFFVPESVCVTFK